ncbi:hypothetical protein Tcan_16512 [Toxocara canis]|uniref:Uncharacterized protein n=1 Tax=Toxocara canis TaxID=6265 RepID=A0A0B2VNT6_TOXCA|nr:hypothetical protein Tcan_16512 [Toxocara canis]
MQISPDHSYLALCVDDDHGAQIIVFDSETFGMSAKYDVHIVAIEMRISATNEFVWAIHCDNRTVTLICYSLFEGKIIASGKVRVDMPVTSWQVSLCPADDGIACLLITSRAILLRISGGDIENFSEIELFDVQCHDWSNDVTLAFGTSSCQIRLYRETTPLEIVDLRKLSNQLISGSESPVTLMYSTAEKFLCVVAGVLVFVFDIKNGECQWGTASTIVVGYF